MAKSVVTAYVLWGLFGCFGIHRFYVNQFFAGILYFLTAFLGIVFLVLWRFDFDETLPGLLAIGIVLVITSFVLWLSDSYSLRYHVHHHNRTTKQIK